MTHPTARFPHRLWLLLLAGPTSVAAQDGPSTLAGVVQAALERHPLLLAAAARQQSAQHAVNEARGGLRPQARLDASATQFQEPMVVAPLHGFNPQEPPLFDRTLMQLQASVSMVVFDGGIRRARVRQAARGADRGSEEERAAAATVVTDVVRAWLAVATGRALVATETARVDALGSEAARVTQLLEVGRAAPVEALRIRAALERAMADRTVAESSLHASEDVLARLTGLSPAVVRAMPVPPARAVGALPSAEEFRATMRSASPEVAAAELQLAMARAEAEAVAGLRWPELRLHAGYSEYASGQGRLTGEWQAGLRAGFPVYTGGARRSAVQRTSHDANAAQLARDALLRRLDDAVDRELAVARGAAARATALGAAVTLQAEVERIERLALEAGAGTTRDWIAAQADLVSARSGLVQAQHSEIIARVELARLAGTLTAASLTTLLEPQP